MSQVSTTFCAESITRLAVKCGPCDISNSNASTNSWLLITAGTTAAASMLSSSSRAAARSFITFAVYASVGSSFILKYFNIVIGLRCCGATCPNQCTKPFGHRNPNQWARQPVQPIPPRGLAGQLRTGRPWQEWGDMEDRGGGEGGQRRRGRT
eukprot:5291551-Pyramimonas_sp.AAC.1